MRRPALLLLLSSLAATCAAAGDPASPAPSAAAPSAPAPPRALDRDALGAFIRQAPGRARVMTFWATWCGPCMAELPRLRSFAGRHPEVEVVLVNVDVRAMHAARVLPTIHAQNLDGLSHLLLASDNPSRDLGAVVPGWVDEIPFTLIQRADGSVSASRAVPVSEPDLERLIAAAAQP